MITISCDVTWQKYIIKNSKYVWTLLSPYLHTYVHKKEAPTKRCPFQHKTNY